MVKSVYALTPPTPFRFDVWNEEESTLLIKRQLLNVKTGNCSWTGEKKLQKVQSHDESDVEIVTIVQQSTCVFSIFTPEWKLYFR